MALASARPVGNEKKYQNALTGWARPFSHSKTPDVLPPLNREGCVSFITTNLDNYGVGDRELLEVAFALVLKSSINNPAAVQRLIDLAIICAQGKRVTNNLPILLLDIYSAAKTIKELDFVFDFCASRVGYIKQLTIKVKQRLRIIKFFNDILRRFSPATDAELCGRVMMLMVKFVPLEELGGHNINGKIFDCRNDYDEEAGAGKQLAAEDVELYKMLWGAQSILTNPKLLEQGDDDVRRATFKKFLKDLDFIFTEFGNNPIDEDDAKRHYRSNLDQFGGFYPKYLTAKKMLKYQKRDPSFRRHVLVQIIIFCKSLFQREWRWECRSSDKTTWNAYPVEIADKLEAALIQKKIDKTIKFPGDDGTTYEISIANMEKRRGGSYEGGLEVSERSGKHRKVRRIPNDDDQLQRKGFRELRDKDHIKLRAVMLKGYQILAKMPPSGKTFTEIIKTIMRRERRWENWKHIKRPNDKGKMLSCQPPIPRAAVGVAGLLQEAKDQEDEELKPPPSKRRRRNLGSEMGLWQMGCEELDTLWWDTPCPTTAAKLEEVVNSNPDDPTSNMKWLSDPTTRKSECSVEEKVNVMAEEEAEWMGAQSRINDTYQFETLRVLRNQEHGSFSKLQFEDERKNFMYHLLELKRPGLMEKISKQPKSKRKRKKKMIKKIKTEMKPPVAKKSAILKAATPEPSTTAYGTPTTPAEPDKLRPPIHSVKVKKSRSATSSMRSRSGDKKKKRKRSRSSSRDTSYSKSSKKGKKKKGKKSKETEMERRIRKRKERFQNKSSSRERSEKRRRR